jgi:hypothetical protein
LLKVVRNAEAALRQAGYTIEFSGNYDGDPALTARKGAQWILVTTGSDRYWITTVKAEEMAQEMQSTAELMGKDISAAGHAAVYGIYFDTDRAEIKPESGRLLGQTQTTAPLLARPRISFRAGWTPAKRYGRA